MAVSGDGAVNTADMSSLPNAMLTLEFFSNDACDDSGHVEVENQLRPETVSTVRVRDRKRGDHGKRSPGRS